MKHTQFLTRKLRTRFRTAPTNGQPVNTEGEPNPQGQPQNANADGNPDNSQEQNAGAAGQGVTFTPEQQNVIDAVVAERVARAEKKVREAEAEKRKREGMEESERLKAEKADIERERDEARDEAKFARWEAQTAAHVVDTEAALLIIKQNPEKYTDAAGKVKVDQLLKDKPYLKRDAPKQTGPGTGGAMGDAGDPKKDLGAALASDRAAGRRK